ncbi:MULTISPECIES: C39 family peptidase [Niallia]|uniref:C39 family peptidase n=1 Tax=Niallia hominis TaxID=3133173 RepID=A0ABV1F416_9BACI|nr:C39 family peptidase [Niallia circulans]MCF2648284.1 C39 family peptidase [Niallia circulans]
MKLQFIILIMISLLITSVLIILLVKRTNIVIISLTTLYLIILFSLFSIDNGKLKRILRKEVIVDIPLPEFMMKKGEEEPKEVEDIIKEVNQPSKKVDTIKKEILLDAPIIKQFPELPRGCEVTSLAMFLQYYQVKTDKMELAKKIERDKTPLSTKNGKIHWGDPNDGYIGDMYSYSKPGYGVYHRPIIELAEEYLPNKIDNLTGKQFEELKLYLSKDRPVWIITNTTYQKLPNSSFEEWETPNGKVKITYKEHSVLITGYDESFVYFNDPISGEKNKKEPLGPFIDAWKQMGSQALSLKYD